MTFERSVYNSPISTVDVIIFTIIDNALHVLTIKRAEHPYRNKWSLVGGFVDIEQDKNIEET